MRSFLEQRLVRSLLAFFHKRGNKDFGMAFLLLVVPVGGGLFLVGDAATVGAQQYSAYSDPEKPAISYVFSDPQNVAEFQEKFALSDEDLSTVLAAIRKENETLARVYGESQQIVESNEGQPTEQVESKIKASGYDEKVRKALAQTKIVLKRVLSTDQWPEFKAWVDDKWLQERQKFNEEPATLNRAQATSTGMTFRVFATQYNGYTNYEVALPYRKLKFAGGYWVQLSRSSGYWPRAPVKEVGPWNTYDNYWARYGRRIMWADLPRGVPEAQAAYYNNYNQGRDEFGRKVLNPAGVDLTPAVAAKLGLRKYQNAWIYVYMPWVSQ